MLGKRAEDQVKFGALIGDAVKIKLAVGEGEPLLGTGGPEGGKLDASVNRMLRSGSGLLWRDDWGRLRIGGGEGKVVVILHGVLVSGLPLLRQITVLRIYVVLSIPM